MPELLSALPLLVPVLYVSAAAASVRRGRWALAEMAAVGAVVVAIGAALSGQLDGVSAVMLLLVTVILSVILRFADRYLDGEPGRDRFLRWFLLVAAAVAVLVTTNNLLVLALAWAGSSLALHQLLVFFPDRPEALIAAHKKFLLSRVADGCIFLAVGLIWVSLGTLAIDELVVRAALLPDIPVSLAAGGLLLAIGVVLRSAQLPFHGWLIQVMEAPTPVSALLHAGVVNIGGFVMIRLGMMMARLDAAQMLLVLAGTVTAVLAGLVVSTRVSVKVSLAWSTAAQMGFMLIECGLGAYGLALLHLVAHSLYKAHAFLGSGRAVEQALRREMTPTVPSPGPGAWLLAVLASAGLVSAVGALSGPAVQREPDLVVFGVILTLALAPGLVRVFVARGGRLLVPALLSAAGAVVLYAGLHRGFSALVAPALTDGGFSPVRAGIVVAGFALLFLVQVTVTSRPGGWLARRLYPACFAGFYLDEVFTRLTFLLWPPRPAWSGTAPARWADGAKSPVGRAA